MFDGIYFLFVNFGLEVLEFYHFGSLLVQFLSHNSQLSPALFFKHGLQGLELVPILFKELLLISCTHARSPTIFKLLPSLLEFFPDIDLLLLDDLVFFLLPLKQLLIVLVLILEFLVNASKQFGLLQAKRPELPLLLPLLSLQVSLQRPSLLFFLLVISH